MIERQVADDALEMGLTCSREGCEIAGRVPFTGNTSRLDFTRGPKQCCCDDSARQDGSWRQASPVISGVVADLLRIVSVEEVGRAGVCNT